MNQKKCLKKSAVSLSLVFVLSSCVQSSYRLIEPDEYDRSTGHDGAVDDLIDRAIDPLAPKIIVNLPQEGDSYISPIDIDVSFISADDAQVVPDSLRIRYGAFGIDVTNRVVENATVGTTGIKSNGAELPPGRHSLTVSIKDTKGRLGKGRFRFRIEKK